MTRIKICGITNLEDALFAVQCGADALGFIGVPESPRYVGRFDGWDEIPSLVPPPVTCICVCRTVTDALQGFETLQTYSLPNSARPPRKRLILTARISGPSSLEDLAVAIKQPGVQPPAALLLDAYSPGALGGTGERFDWALAKQAQQRFGLPVILAGGLTPENVAEAIIKIQPWMVDVASGVEAEPGRKDPAKVNAFCEAVRNASREV